MPSHIVWDWNGTLLDDVQACVEAINRMLEDRRLPCIDRQHYRNIFDFPVKSYYARLGFNLEIEDWDDIANEFHRHYGELAATAALRPGATASLTALQDSGMTMSILSASEITLLERMLKERGIRQYFEHVFGLHDRYASSKLEQGRCLMKALALPPGDILLVGDTNHDYHVAQVLGIRCVLLTSGHQSEDRLAQFDTIQQIADLLTHPAVSARQTS